MGEGLISINRSVAAPGANTDILATDLTPSGNVVAFGISVQLETASVFNVMETIGGTTRDVAPLKNAALVAGALYEFAISVDQAATYNFQVETDSVIDRLYVSMLTDG